MSNNVRLDDLFESAVSVATPEATAANAAHIAGLEGTCCTATKTNEYVSAALSSKLNKGEVEGAIGELKGEVAGLKAETKEKVDKTVFEVTAKAIEKALENKVSRDQVENIIHSNVSAKYATKDEIPVVPAPIDTSIFARREDLRHKADVEDLQLKADKAELAAYAKAKDLSNFATRNELEGYATIERVSGLAHKTDLYDLVTKEELETRATKAELKNYATKEELDTKANKEVLDLYTKKEELPNFELFAKQAEVNDKANKADLLPLATKEEVSKKAEKVDLIGMVKEGDLREYAKIADLDGYAKRNEFYAKVDRSELDKYALQREVDNKANKEELYNYATKKELAEKISRSELDNLATKHEVARKANKEELAEYARREELDLVRKFNPEKLQEIALRVDDVLNFSTRLGEVAYKKDIKDIPNMATKLEVQSAIMDIQENLDEKINFKADKIELGNYITKDEYRQKAALKADSKYVNEQLDVKAGKAEVAEDIKNVKDEIRVAEKRITADLTRALNDKADKAEVEEDIKALKVAQKRLDEQQDAFISGNTQKILDAITKEAEDHLLQEVAIKANKEDLTKTNEKVDQLKLEILDKLEKTRAGLAGDLTGLDSKYADRITKQVNVDIDALRKQLTDTAGELTANVAKNTGSIDALNATVGANKASLDADIVRLTGLIGENKSYATNHVDDLERKLAQVDTDSKARDTEASVKIAALEKIIEENKGSAKTNTDDLSKVIDANNETANQNITNVRAELNKAKKELTDAIDAAREALAGQISDVKVAGATKEEVVSGYVTKEDAAKYALKTDLHDLSKFETKEVVATKATIADLDGVKTRLEEAFNKHAGNAAEISALKSAVAALQGIDVGATSGEIADAKLKPVLDKVTELTATVDTKADKSELTPLAKKAEVEATYAKKSELVDYAKKSDATALEGRVAANEAAVAKKADKTAVDGLEAKVNALPSKADVNSAIDTKLQGYQPTVDFAPYAKKADLAPFAKSTDLTGLAKASDVESTYAKKSEIVGLAKDSDVKALQAKVQEIESKPAAAVPGAAPAVAFATIEDFENFIFSKLTPDTPDWKKLTSEQKWDTLKAAIHTSISIVAAQ